jgi:hypothetical protein
MKEKKKEKAAIASRFHPSILAMFFIALKIKGKTSYIYSVA